MICVLIPVVTDRLKWRLSLAFVGRASAVIFQRKFFIWGGRDDDQIQSNCVFLGLEWCLVDWNAVFTEKEPLPLSFQTVLSGVSKSGILIVKMMLTRFVGSRLCKRGMFHSREGRMTDATVRKESSEGVRWEISLSGIQGSLQKLMSLPLPTNHWRPRRNLSLRLSRRPNCQDVLVLGMLKISLSLMYFSLMILTHMLVGSEIILHRRRSCRAQFISKQFLIPSPPRSLFSQMSSQKRG